MPGSFPGVFRPGRCAPKSPLRGSLWNQRSASGSQHSSTCWSRAETAPGDSQRAQTNLHHHRVVGDWNAGAVSEIRDVVQTHIKAVVHVSHPDPGLAYLVVLDIVTRGAEQRPVRIEF